MKFRFFTIPALDPDEVQDELNSFLGMVRVLSVDRELVREPQGVYWAICVSYMEARNTKPPIKRGRVDYREVLSQDDFETFARLRELRKQVAQSDGVPVYAVFTNEQLASMVTQRARYLSDLTEIPGVGKSKVEKNGEAFLDLLRRLQEEQVEPGGENGGA